MQLELLGVFSQIVSDTVFPNKCTRLYVMLSENAGELKGQKWARKKKPCNTKVFDDR